MIKVKEDVSPYDKTIEMNNSLGLTPRANRYSVAGEGFYGLYDNFDKLQDDLEDIGYNGKKIWSVVKEEPDKSTYKAFNETFKLFFKKNGSPIIKYQIVPLNEDNINTLIFPERLRLFTHV